MALIGFLFLIAIGVVLIGSGLIMAYMAYGFSGRIEPILPLLFVVAGNALIYFAVTHSPIAISWIAT